MAKTKVVRRLPIARDLAMPDIARMDEARARCRQHFALHGYDEIETPLLEQTELFLRKSGGELASRLYAFTDPGGYQVSLRPEFTAPVIRHVIEEVATRGVPLRYHYSGPVFRYPSSGTTSSSDLAIFTQAGAELVGGSAPDGDGEVIAMAWSGLGELGVPSPTVAIGHVGLLWELLRPYGLSDRAQLFLVQSVGRLRGGERAKREVRAQASEIGLLRNGRNGSGGRSDTSVEIVESLLSRTLGGPLGQVAGARTADEIMARLARKLQTIDDERAFDSALAYVSNLAVVRGPIGEALKRGRAIAKAARQDAGPFDALQGVVDAAVARGVPRKAITVDLGLARDIAYYTGSLFDLSSAESAASFGGGGRYDGLMNSLGAGADIPATGFAFNLDAVVAASNTIVAPPKPARVAVAPDVRVDARAALEAASAHAAKLRGEGKAAVLIPAGEAATLKRAAKAAGASEIVVVGSDGRTRASKA
jgi:histidyl-tRNA synthetase